MMNLNNSVRNFPKVTTSLDFRHRRWYAIIPYGHKAHMRLFHILLFSSTHNAVLKQLNLLVVSPSFCAAQSSRYSSRTAFRSLDVSRLVNCFRCLRGQITFHFISGVFMKMFYDVLLSFL